MSSDEGSDIELKSTLPKKSIKKMPPSPSEDLLKKTQEKKLTKKVMINQALIELKSRKGVSLYAIKKFITEKYHVDTERNGYYIKNYLKSAVENGTIVQIKGIGASGSFKLVPVKEKKPKPKKTTKEKSEKAKNPEKKTKLEKDTEKIKKTDEKKLKQKSKAKENKSSNEDKTTKPKKKVDKEKAPKEKKDGVEKIKKIRIAKGMQTPAKKKLMMKRKSIGSIIKPPKMKPEAHS